MPIEILWPWELEDLTGKTTIIVDLWAATSNIALLLGKGVKNLIVINKENAIKAKEIYKNAIVVGEHYQLPDNFFDYSNYPSDVNKINTTESILYMTTNGSYVIEQAISKKAKSTLTGSLLNFNSIIQYLNRSKQEQVVIIPAGNRVRGNGKAEEDILCAELFSKALSNQKINWDGQIKMLKKIIVRDYGSEDKFNEAADFPVIFQLNKYNVVPMCLKEKWIEIKDLNKRIQPQN